MPRPPRRRCLSSPSLNGGPRRGRRRTSGSDRAPRWQGRQSRGSTAGQTCIFGRREPGRGPGREERPVRPQAGRGRGGRPEEEASWGLVGLPQPHCPVQLSGGSIHWAGSWALRKEPPDEDARKTRRERQTRCELAVGPTSHSWARHPGQVRPAATQSLLISPRSRAARPQGRLGKANGTHTASRLAWRSGHTCPFQRISSASDGPMANGQDGAWKWIWVHPFAGGRTGLFPVASSPSLFPSPGFCLTHHQTASCLSCPGPSSVFSEVSGRRLRGANRTAPHRRHGTCQRRHRRVGKHGIKFLS